MSDTNEDIAQEIRASDIDTDTFEDVEAFVLGRSGRWNDSTEAWSTDIRVLLLHLREIGRSDLYRSLILLAFSLDLQRQRVAELESQNYGLKKHIAELESHPHADRDRELRERDKAMEDWMEEVTSMLGVALSYCGRGTGILAELHDNAIAAMRKGDQDGK